MTKIIHISDLHLCDNFGSSIINPFEMREIQWQSIINVVNFSNNNDVDFILICGDLYERKYFSENHGRRLISILSKFKGVTLIIFGNHDFVGENFVFDNIEIPDNIILHTSNKIKRYDFNDHDLSIFMHSWEKAFEYTPNLISLDISNKHNLLMIHSGTSVDETALPFKNDQVDRKVDYIALGHIHKPSISNERMYYPGSLEPLNSKETGKHGGYLIEINDVINVEFLDLSSVEYLDLTIDTQDKTVEDIFFIASRHKNKKKQILKLKLVGQDFFVDSEEVKYSLKQIFEYVTIIDNRIIDINVVGFNSRLMNEIDKVLLEKFEGEYREDLKRKIISLMNRAGKV